MIAGCRNYITICNLGFAIFTPSVAGVSCFVATLSCRITNLCIHVLCAIKRTISNITYRTYCLCRAGSSTAAVFSLIYDIATSNYITFVPVVSIIGRPNRCRAMFRFRNGLTICYLCVTAGAICITGITFLIARGFFLTYKVCTAGMIGAINFAVCSFTNRANCPVFTSSSTTTMVCIIELRSTATSVIVLCSVAFPFTVCINVIAGCRNYITICNLGFAIFTPSVAGVSCFVATLSCRITNLCIHVLCAIKRTISNITYRTYCLCRAGSSTAAVFCLIYDIATSDYFALVPVVSIISRPNRCRTMVRFRNGLSICNLGVTTGTICITGITFFIARGLFLTYKMSTTNVIRRIKRTISIVTNSTYCFFLTVSSTTGMVSKIKLSTTRASTKVLPPV